MTIIRIFILLLASISALSFGTSVQKGEALSKESARNIGLELSRVEEAGPPRLWIISIDFNRLEADGGRLRTFQAYLYNNEGTEISGTSVSSRDSGKRSTVSFFFHPDQYDMSIAMLIACEKAAPQPCESVYEISSVKRYFENID